MLFTVLVIDGEEFHVRGAASPLFGWDNEANGLKPGWRSYHVYTGKLLCGAVRPDLVNQHSSPT